MKRIYKVMLSNVFDSKFARWHYEVVAGTASKAIDKATAQAKREGDHRTGWLIEEVLHRGPAI